MIRTPKFYYHVPELLLKNRVMKCSEAFIIASDLKLLWNSQFYYILLYERFSVSYMVS